MVVGVTGGIGSGKTTFCNVLRERGYLVYDTDKEARNLQNTHPVLIAEIKAMFGNDIYNTHGLDRKKLGAIVFENAHLLQQLSAIVHPFVRNSFAQWINDHSNQELLFVECAILFEGGFNQFTNCNILITAEEDVRIKRVQKRDGISTEMIKKRIDKQWPDSKKKLLSDFIVHTDDGIISTEQKVDEILKALIQLTENK